MGANMVSGSCSIFGALPDKTIAMLPMMIAQVNGGIRWNKAGIAKAMKKVNVNGGAMLGLMNRALPSLVQL